MTIGSFTHVEPSEDFIEDLCDVIASKVTSKVRISGLNLSCKQFLALVTASDNLEMVCYYSSSIDLH